MCNSFFLWGLQDHNNFVNKPQHGLFSAKAYCSQRNIYYKVTGLAAPQKEQKYIMTYCKIIFWWSYIEYSIFFHKNPLLISSGAMQDCANKTSNNLNKIWGNSFKEGGPHFWSYLLLSLSEHQSGGAAKLPAPRTQDCCSTPRDRDSPRGPPGGSVYLGKVPNGQL